MKTSARFLALAILIPTFEFQSTYSQNPTAKTKSGLVTGYLNQDKSVAIYKGVPYAAPPIGDLRWKEPQPLKPWKETRACTKFSASPYQNTPAPFMMWSAEFIAPPEPLSEDCLYLNVWSSANTKENLPVLVYIYGGGFVSGSSACAVYDGEALARQGIVYVSINYRVGVFGFLSHPGLTKESPYHASGNYALLDQIAALKWVKENIASFGGDPNQVTIAGQSAGSFSVQALVASPLAKGLFHGAIAQSGASFSRFSKSLSEAEKTGEALSQKIGKSDIESLRKLSSDSLLKLANAFSFGTFGVVIDGYVIPNHFKEIFQNKKHNDVPLMAGWVMGDAALMRAGQQSKEKFVEWVTTTYGNKKEEFLKIFPANTDEEVRKSQDKFGLMQFAAYPDHQWAGYNSSNCYLYQFSYVPTDKPGFPNYGALHTADVPFALHTLKLWDRPWTETDYNVENTMTSYWVNFVKTGNPNGAELPEWKPYDSTSGNIMELNRSAELKPALYENEFKILESTDN